MYKIINSNRNTIIGSFLEKELLLRALKTTYYPETGSLSTDEVKAVLDLSNYAAKKN